MAIQNNFPAVRPSLNLDFANTKVLDSRISYTRASEARYYDGKTVAKAEENLLVRSQEFDTVPWSVNGTVTVAANTTTAPDGTSSADTIDNTASGTSFRFQDVTLTVGLQYVWSVYVKNSTATVTRLWVRSAQNNASIDLNWTGSTLSSVTQNSGTATFSSVGADWYRVVITYTALEATGRHRIYGGDATNGAAIHLWGAQVEQRSSVTAYTPTTTAPITNYIPVLMTAAANTPRFDHNPVTGECLGFLVEEQRSNLLLRSQEFDDAGWTKTRASVVANAVVAPDGTLTADKVVESTDTGTHLVYRVPAYTLDVVHTLSVYLKAGERKYAQLQWNGAPATKVNLETGTIFESSPLSTIQAVGGGWYRVSITGSKSIVGQGFLILVLNDASESSYTGNGTSGIYIWGAQAEAGSFPTSYIPTVASQVTRSADAASITGANFSSFYRQDEGTLFVECVRGPAGVDRRLASINYGLTPSLDFVILNAGAVSLDNTTVQSLVWTSNSVAAGSPFKAAVTIKQADWSACLNGGSVAQNTDRTVPYLSNPVVSFEIGRRVGSGHLNGHIRAIRYYPVRLSNSQLQALTQ